MSTNTTLNKETLYKIFAIAEQEHKNLFHNISKRKFYKELNQVAEKIETLDKKQINYELMRLFALFRDGHTDYKILTKKLPLKFYLIEDKFIIIEISNKHSELLYSEIKSINGVDVREIYNKAKSLISAENEFWLNYKIFDSLRNAYFLNALGLKNCDKSIEIVVGDKGYKINSLDTDTIKSPYFVRTNNYSLTARNDKLIFTYSKCKEDENYSIDSLIKDLQNKLLQNDKLIIDLRFNSGGNSAYFNRVINEVLRPKHIKGIALINEGCYSSTMFAVADLKRLGFILLGSNTGGELCTYGELNICDVDGWKFSVSKKYFDKRNKKIRTKHFVKPDIYIANTLADYKNNNDNVLNKAIELLD